MRVRSVRRTDLLLGGVVFLVTVVLLGLTHQSIGFVRDEGYYFTAAEHYEGWFLELGRAFGEGRFADPFRDATIDKHWEYNHEHPVLAKTLFALSHLVVHRWLGWVDPVTAWRLPAFFFGGLLSFSIFLLARPWGRGVAVLAPVLFWAVPRHFFHGHLACFDIPVAALWCLFLAAYGRSVRLGRGALLTGAVFGLALATKHNAFFLPFVVLAHWLLTGRQAVVGQGDVTSVASSDSSSNVPSRRAPIRALLHRIPRAVWAMAVLGPVIVYVHWPWLWHAPVSRVKWWLEFHARHVHYPWQYFGEVLRAPPFPAEYPLALEMVTLPATLLVAIALGLGLWAKGLPSLLRRSIRGRLDGRESELLLILLGAAVAIGPFLTTRVPIFGGVKHWMAAIALLCIPAAALVWSAGSALVQRAPAAGAVALSLLVLAPAAWQTARFHPFGTSAYNELAGGAAGGAALGMQRQYWSNNVTAVLPWINDHAPQRSAVYLHEVNRESFFYYQRTGAIRSDLRYAHSPRQAAIAAYQYHQEFRDREFEIWTASGKRRPEFTFAIDEAPQVVVYRMRE